MIRVGIDKQVTRRIKKRLHTVRRNLSRAQASAINRTLTGTVAQGSKLIRQDVNVKAAKLKRNLRKHRARAGRPVGAIDVSGAHLRAIDMGRYGKTAQGITYKPYKRRRRILLKGAFVAMMPSGHFGIFRRNKDKHMRKGSTPYRQSGSNKYRKNKHSETIKEIWGPSVMTFWDRVDKKIYDYAEDRMIRELQRQLEYYRSRG